MRRNVDAMTAAPEPGPIDSPQSEAAALVTDAELAAPRLPLARYRVRFRGRSAEDDAAALVSRRGYLGSAWRGAFGHALRKTVCVTRLPECDPCVLLWSCPYPFLFESRTPPGARKLTRYPRTPGPYVLEPSERCFDRDGDTVNLGLALFGPANDHLPYVVHALERAGRHGLTGKRVKLELVDLQVEVRDADAAAPARWATVYEPGARLTPAPPMRQHCPDAPSALRVRLLSPLRIKRHERHVGAAEFDFRAFFGGLLRRISLLTHFYSDTPLETDFAGLLTSAESVTVAKHRDFHWREWARRSSRQAALLQMGGLVGRFDLTGASLEPFWPYLWLGQWTHAGKGCSMGLGRYVLEPVGDAGAAPNGRRWPAPSRL